VRRTGDVPLRVGTQILRLSTGEQGIGPPATPDGVVIATATLAPFAQPVAGIPSDLAERLSRATATVGMVGGRAAVPGCVPLAVDGIRNALLQELAPENTVPPRVRVQIALPPGLWDSATRLAPILVGPRITTPMMRPLVGLGQDWLLPGLGAVPPQTLAVLVPNRPFIEAYMVGLNHEMGRELLWRGFPTDQRATVFDRFWDTAASVGQAGTPERDIEPMHTWSAASALGDHTAPGNEALLVLLIRSELVRRFPDATIFLQKAQATAGGGRTPRPLGPNATAFPLFRGRLDPDILYLGFPVSVDDAKGGTAAAPQGWYIAFQEQPGQLAFGLTGAGDDPQAANPDNWNSWNDLVWEAMRLTPGGWLDLVATTALGLASAPVRPADLPASRFTPPWDGRADSMAAITVKRPVRLFVHASELLP
jgi:hypothetical protein